MKLEVGKYYKCRNGIVVGPVRRHVNLGHIHYDVAGGIYAWTESGQVINAGVVGHQMDIVKEVHINKTVVPSVQAVNVDKGLKQTSTPNPYRRTLPTYEDGTSDVYTVLKGFGVTCPATQHAIKKLLVTGGRNGGKSRVQDLEEALASIQKAIELEKIG